MHANCKSNKGEIRVCLCLSMSRKTYHCSYISFRPSCMPIVNPIEERKNKAVNLIDRKEPTVDPEPKALV